MMAPFFIRRPSKPTVNKHACYQTLKMNKMEFSQLSFSYLDPFFSYCELSICLRWKKAYNHWGWFVKRKKKKGCERGFSSQCVECSMMRVWRKGRCEYLASQGELQRKLFSLQCNLGHNTLNTRRKVGRYIMQVRVFSSLLMQECVCICVFCVLVLGQHMILHEPFFFAWEGMSPLDGSYRPLWGIPGATSRQGNYQWVWSTSTHTHTHTYTHTDTQPDSESLPLAHPLCCVCVPWNIRGTQPCHFQWWGKVDCSPEREGLRDTLPVMGRQKGDREAEGGIGTDKRRGDMWR